MHEGPVPVTAAIAQQARDRERSRLAELLAMLVVRRLQRDSDRTLTAKKAYLPVQTDQPDSP